MDLLRKLKAAKKAKKLLEKDFISDEIKKISVLSKDLETLNTEIDLKERETGLYELYTGFPIIVGKLADGTKVRAPLFLFPSKIYKKEGEWKYVNLNKEKITTYSIADIDAQIRRETKYKGKAAARIHQ